MYVVLWTLEVEVQRPDVWLEVGRGWQLKDGM